MDWQALATTQHGVIGAQQAAACGLSRAQVRWQLASGRWQRLGHGLYLTGPTSWLAQAQAAVLRAGVGSLLTGSSSAHLHGLTTRPPAAISVAVPRE